MNGINIFVYLCCMKKDMLMVIVEKSLVIININNIMYSMYNIWLNLYNGYI